MAEPVVHEVTIEEVPAPGRPILERLLQLYLHDFSEHAPLGSPHGEVGEDGLFVYSWLDGYWREEGRVPLLVRADGHIAGFALLNRWSALDRPLDRSVAEFFVLRKYRRARVGTRAAGLIFRRYRGRWEVPVAGYNPQALRFWRSAIDALGPQGVTEQMGDGGRWSGPVLCLET